jgi:hypothetical protein
MLANVDEHPVLASNPHFVNYILYAPGPGQVYSIRDIGLKILVAACQSLLHAYDADSLVTLAGNCDLVPFLRRAILHQDPPTMLKDVLRINDEDFNGNLLRILAPALGDPFNALLAKLCDEPNKIPERDLRDLEIALVLSNNEGRKKTSFRPLRSLHRHDATLGPPVSHGATARCYRRLAPPTRRTRERGVRGCLEGVPTAQF